MRRKPAFTVVRPEIATGKGRGTVLQVVGVVVLAFALLNVTSGLRLLGVKGATATAATARQVSDNVTVAGGVQMRQLGQQHGGLQFVQAGVFGGYHDQIHRLRPHRGRVRDLAGQSITRTSLIGDIGPHFAELAANGIGADRGGLPVFGSSQRGRGEQIGHR